MWRENKKHLQKSMLGTLNSLPRKYRKRLEKSWAGTFYRECFARIDERPFAVLFSEVYSRPNIPVNVLVGLEVLKAGFGWSDEEMWDAFCFNMQVRFALGYHDLVEGHFDIRTVYNFRRRLLEHMGETGEDLLGKALEQITDEQIAAHGLKTGKLRMDSTFISSNIRNFSRLQLLVEILHRVHRMLSEIDQERYAADFAPYLKGTSTQHVYRVNSEEGRRQIEQIGQLMGRLVDDLEAIYASYATYQILRRVFQEHFVIEESSLRPKKGPELSASSLNSPDDLEATFRRKRNEPHKGYVARRDRPMSATNLTETCDPDNEVQLVTLAQTAPNVTNDDDLLIEALPSLKERLDVNELYTDGNYNSLESYEAMRDLEVEHVQTAIGGHAPHRYLGLNTFDIETSSQGIPETITCPNGQQVEVKPSRAQGHYLARFDASQCAKCPHVTRCRTHQLKRLPCRTLYFDEHDIEIARRRRRIAKDRREGRNLRAAVESTIAALKHPFRRDKLPVRGWFRVNSMIVCGCLMVNVRRLHRYLTGPEPLREVKAARAAVAKPLENLFFFVLRRLGQSLNLMGGLKPLACRSR